MSIVDRTARHAEAMRRVQAAGLDGLALVPGPNLAYLSGLDMHLSERPTVLVYPVKGRPGMLLPELERGRAAARTEGVGFYCYSDEEGFAPAFCRLASELALDGKRIAVEYVQMRALELRALEAAAPHAEYVSLEESLLGLRAIKDERELDATREAIRITEAALHALRTWTVTGLTERDVAQRLTAEMLGRGADSVAFMIAVAGPNGADPHAGPSERPLQRGDLLTIDCGAVHNGYIADITRTFAIGPVRGRLREIYEVVREANAAGRAAVKPGVAAQDVDRSARAVIEAAGYGEQFFHRTGHGLGLETHEPPYIVEGNERLLEPGMLFTVEPGIYVSGLGGVRIEDDVVVTLSGAQTLTTFPREWTVLD
jgi:Xaa-Pro dipeptidase